MGGITKSLWELTDSAANGVPAGSDRILYAPEPGVSLVTQCKSSTFAAIQAAIIAAGVVVKVATLQLTDAQIKTLPTDSPVSILAADPVGVNLPLAVFVRLNPWFVDYATIDVTASLKVKFGAVSASAEEISMLSFGAASADSAVGLIGQTVVALTAYENTAIELVCTNGALGNFTGGDARQFLTITVLYLPIFIGI